LRRINTRRYVYLEIPLAGTSIHLLCRPDDNKKERKKGRKKKEKRRKKRERKKGSTSAKITGIPLAPMTS